MNLKRTMNSIHHDQIVIEPPRVRTIQFRADSRGQDILYKRLAFPFVVRYEWIERYDKDRVRIQHVFVAAEIPKDLHAPLSEFPLTFHTASGVNDYSHYSENGKVCYSGNVDTYRDPGELLWNTVHSRWDSWFVDRWEAITKTHGAAGAQFALSRGRGVRSLDRIVTSMGFGGRWSINDPLRLGKNDLTRTD